MRSGSWEVHLQGHGTASTCHPHDGLFKLRLQPPRLVADGKVNQTRIDAGATKSRKGCSTTVPIDTRVSKNVDGSHFSKAYPSRSVCTGQPPEFGAAPLIQDRQA